jgi:hypothetical protein
MKFAHTATIPFAAGKIHLGEWLFTMSDEEYQAAARQHRGLGTFVENGARGMINVEAIGHVLMVQHYHEVQIGKSLVELFSERSRAYLMHVLPVPVQVRWTMSITPGIADESTFSCTVEPAMPAFLHLMSWATGVLWFIRRHTVEETAGFAADITRKLRGQGVARAAAAQD